MPCGGGDAHRLLHKSDTSGSRSFRDLLLTFTLPSPRRAQPDGGWASATHVLSPSHAAVRNAAAEDYAWTQVRSALDIVAVLCRALLSTFCTFPVCLKWWLLAVVVWRRTTRTRLRGARRSWRSRSARTAACPRTQWSVRFTCCSLCANFLSSAACAVRVGACAACVAAAAAAQCAPPSAAGESAYIDPQRFHCPVVQCATVALLVAFLQTTAKFSDASYVPSAAEQAAEQQRMQVR